MNKYKRIILLCCTVLMGGLFINSSSGPGPGYTPAPFDSQTCGSCHGGGSFGTGVNLQLLSGSTVVSSYLPGQSYTVRINVSGSSPALGFQITSAFLGSNNNINNWGTLPPNTHNVNAGGHNYIEHTSPLTTSTIDIPWTAPYSTTNVVFYTSVNRVNLNGGTNGDQVVTGTMNIPSGCATITVGPSSLPGGTVGSAYNQTITQSGATGSPTYTVSSGSLPAGLTLNPTTGAITGTPTTTGTSNFTITVTGGNGCTGSQSYSVTITCPTVTVSPATIPTMVVGTAVNQTYTQTGARRCIRYVR